MISRVKCKWSNTSFTTSILCLSRKLERRS
nr:MAG TPA: hypothetical protein [Crassvirales sp.]DAX04538.1 MAG TPA: hypothetical protein [Bacteriophage sp.]